MNEISFELPAITRYQRDAIFCGERSVVIEATTKAGKTYGCSPIAPRVVQKVLDPFAYFAERRKDPEWGWERARRN